MIWRYGWGKLVRFRIITVRRLNSWGSIRDIRVRRGWKRWLILIFSRGIWRVLTVVKIIRMLTIYFLNKIQIRMGIPIGSFFVLEIVKNVLKNSIFWTWLNGLLSTNKVWKYRFFPWKNGNKIVQNGIKPGVIYHFFKLTSPAKNTMTALIAYTFNTNSNTKTIKYISLHHNPTLTQECQLF